MLKPDALGWKISERHKTLNSQYCFLLTSQVVNEWVCDPYVNKNKHLPWNKVERKLLTKSRMLPTK